MAVMIGIGAMMGPGIFALPGVTAGLVGPLAVLVYLAMGLLTVFTALNYSELGAATPIAGGGYSFTSRTLPRPLAFITGWFFWIGNTLACALYAIIFSLTVREYIWSSANAPAVAIGTTVVFAAINLRGMSESIKVITVMNLIELAILVGFAVLGFSHIEPANLDPIAPLGYGGFAPALALIYISYVGFELITVASEEIVDPGKTIPRAILITLGVGIAIYVAVVLVMVGAVHYTDLSQTDVPFIFVAEGIFGPWGKWAGVTATMMASLSAFSVTLGASARVLYALSRDGHLPYRLSRLHRRFRTPHVALGVSSAVVVVFSATGIVRFAASMSDFGFLMALGVVNLAVVALHRKMPNLRRPFKPGWFPWVPILGAVTTWMFVPSLELRSILLGTAITGIGAAVYLSRPANRVPLRQLLGVRRSLATWVMLRRRKRLRVLIVDGGVRGRNIADRLLASDEYRLVFRSSEHQITFIEESEEVCQQLERRYHAPIYQGDGSKREILEQVGLDNIDVVIATSDDDGWNVLVALQARRLGMARVIAIVQDPDYVSLLEAHGVVAISAPWSTAAMVENYLDRPGVAELFEIGSGEAGLVGVIVPEGARVHGIPIREITIPKECVVAAVIRGETFVVPRGDTTIESGDHVVFVGPPSAIKSAHDFFLLKA